MSILLSAFLLFSLLLGDTCLLQDPPILKLMRMGSFRLFPFWSSCVRNHRSLVQDHSGCREAKCRRACATQPMWCNWVGEGSKVWKGKLAAYKPSLVSQQKAGRSARSFLDWTSPACCHRSRACLVADAESMPACFV